MNFNSCPNYRVLKRANASRQCFPVLRYPVAAILPRRLFVRSDIGQLGQVFFNTTKPDRPFPLDRRTVYPYTPKLNFLLFSNSVSAS